MKKQLLLVLGCAFLGACVAHETDLYAAQAKRDAALMQKRAQTGCTFIRDHDAYRQCILNTYYLSQPQGYETRELTTGQPVAVISNPSAGCGQMGCGSKVAPLPSSGPQIVPYSTTESQTVETTCTQNYQAREASVTTTEVVPAPAPVQIVTQVAPPAPAPAPVAEPAPAPVPVAEPAPVARAPEPDPTWWETYQAEKQPEPVPAQPVCPCPDPNDPCPQCFDK